MVDAQNNVAQETEEDHEANQAERIEPDGMRQLVRQQRIEAS